MTFKVQCVKCKSAYDSSEEDNYYCSNCLFIKKQITAEIDKKRSLNPPVRVKSELEIYEELQKKTGSKFPNYKYLIH